MTDTAAKTKMIARRLQVNIDDGLNTVTFGDTKIEISADGKKVTVYAHEGIQMEAAASAGPVANGTQFSINKDRSEVVLNGVTIRKALDNHLIMAVSEDTVVINKPDPARNIPARAKAEPVSKSPLTAGEKTKDGIYIGRFRSKDGTEKDWFAAAQDAKKGRKKLSLSFKEAVAYAGIAKDFGHRDWVLPPGFDHREEPDILNALYKKQQAIGGFREVRYSPDWYWSSSNCLDRVSARVQRLSDGQQLTHFKSGKMSLRLVRSVPVV